MSTNISLTPELEEYVQKKVSQGLYASASELMHEALRLLRENDVEYLQEMHAELETAANEIDRGEITPLNMQEIINEVDAELAE